MNKTIIKQYIRETFSIGPKLLIRMTTLILFSGLFMNSCQKDESIVVTMGEPVSLNVSETNVVLSQKQADNTAISFNWTRGTNHGTGSSISYSLEIDKAGNDFASPKVYDLGKGVYEKSFTNSDLNDLMLNDWGIPAGTSQDFEARVKADVTMDGVEDDVTDTLAFSVTPYQPVSNVLYLVGDAAPSGWDIANATTMNPSSSQPWIFTYQGALSAGNFKFAVSRETCWCQDFYTQDPNDEGMMVHNIGGSGDDIQWQITEGGNYKLTVDLLDLTISIEQLAGPVYTSLYIVGDASPSGWDIANPEAFTRNADNPFIFDYDVTLTPGDFKISTFVGDWCDGDWLNPSQENQVLTATDFIITHGCDGPDNKWHVTDETQGRYHIKVNLSKSTIAINPFKLYMVGSASPAGWDIGSAVELQQDPTYWYIFTYEGPMVEGEFKFPVNRQSDWGQDMYMMDPSDPTKMYLHHGGDSDDSKWTIAAGEDGNYKITVNVQDLTIDIQKQ